MRACMHTFKYICIHCSLFTFYKLQQFRLLANSVILKNIQVVRYRTSERYSNTSEYDFWTFPIELVNKKASIHLTYFTLNFLFYKSQIRKVR